LRIDSRFELVIATLLQGGGFIKEDVQRKLYRIQIPVMPPQRTINLVFFVKRLDEALQFSTLLCLFVGYEQ
jgi:hypothetical protein